MNRMINAFGRALRDCFRPKIIGITLLPLGLMLVLGMALSHFFWAPAVAAVTAWLDSNLGAMVVGNGLERVGISSVSAVVASVLIFLSLSSVAALISLVLVAICVSPVMVQEVKARRFAQLRALGKDSFIRSVWWSLVSTCIAMAALVVTLPLWLIFPLAFVVPPLIWGWLAYRMFSFDALAKYASTSERQRLLQMHRWPLMIMGIVCGYLGAAPSVIWASGVIFAFAFPVLVPLGIWLYTAVFVLSALWFVHYLLDSLHALRLEHGYDIEVLDAVVVEISVPTDGQ